MPGLSQKPIPPGGQFLYKWRATEYGSYFYHAHSRGQIEDGLYGAIYIQPDDTVERPFRLITDNENDLRAMRKAEEKTRPIMLSDWRHVTSEEMWRIEKATGLEAYCVNALLVNGKGSVNCLGEKTLNEATTHEQRMLLGKLSLSDIGYESSYKQLVLDAGPNTDCYQVHASDPRAGGLPPQPHSRAALHLVRLYPLSRSA